MYYQASHSDEDLPPSNQNRVLGGSSIAANRRSAAASVQHHSLESNMDTLIHQVEKEAYSHVLRAFKCQSDVLTWEKADLMVDLRKELNVSDDEHTELLAKVNTDSTIHQIREWRQTGCYQPARCSTAQPVHDDSPHPTISASLKKQNTSQPFWHQHQSLPGLSSVKNAQHRPAGPAGQRLFTNGSSYSVLLPKAPVQGADFHPLVGKKVWIRLPEDSEFYEAHISKYNPTKGQHALVYDFGGANETMEWIDLHEIPPENIRWPVEDPRPTRIPK